MSESLITEPPVTPPVTPPAAAKGFTADDGNFQDGWLDRLPPELEGGKITLGKYRTLPDLAKAHINLQELLGKKSTAINIPGEGATPEEISGYRKAIGAPEKVEDYKLKPEKLPDGVTLSLIHI